MGNSFWIKKKDPSQRLQEKAIDLVISISTKANKQF